MLASLFAGSILQSMRGSLVNKARPLASAAEVETSSAADAEFLVALGDGCAQRREQLGMTRRRLAQHADVSERYLAQLESGRRQRVDRAAAAYRAVLCRSRPQPCSRKTKSKRLSAASCAASSSACRRIGSRKSPARLMRELGTGAARAPAARRAGRAARRRQVHARRALADDLGFPFVELTARSRSSPAAASTRSQPLRPDRLPALRAPCAGEAIQIYPEAVIATPGGLVSDAATFNLLLAHCSTVWLQAGRRTT